MTTWQVMPSATSLQEAGIKLKVAKSSRASILDVKFEDGVLEIPPLFIDETTQPLFRNLIGFIWAVSPMLYMRLHFLSYAIGQPH